MSNFRGRRYTADATPKRTRWRDWGARLSVLLTVAIGGEAAHAGEGDAAVRTPVTSISDTSHIPVYPGDPVLGPSDALVTIVEFGDFECQFTRRAGPTLQKIVREYAPHVRLVWKDGFRPNLPERDMRAASLARFAYEAGGDRGFWAAHDALVQVEGEWTDGILEKVAAQLGLSWAQVKGAIDSRKYAAHIKRNENLAIDFRAIGTPQFFINGRPLTGAKPYEEFKVLVDSQLVAARSLVAGGTAPDKVYADLMRTAKGPVVPQKRAVPAPTELHPFKGPRSAPVTIQSFSNFQCAECSRAARVLEQVWNAHRNEVKIVWRDVVGSVDKQAPLAAQAAHEAFVQGGNDAFWAYHDKLFGNQQALARPDLERYAREVGLDMPRFRAALDTQLHRGHVELEMQLARAADTQFVPDFAVNDYVLSFVSDYALERFIELALEEQKAAIRAAALDSARGRALLQSGDRQGALQSFSRALEVEPSNPKYAVAVAEAHVALEQHAEATRVLLGAIKSMPRAEQTGAGWFEAYAMLARICEARGDAAGRMSAWEAANQLPDVDRLVAFELGAAYAQAEPPQSNKARRLLGSFVKTACTDPTAAKFEVQCGMARTLLRQIERP